MKRRVLSFILCLALFFTLGGSLWLSLGVSSRAAEVTYSGVLEDLRISDSFSVEKYPVMTLEYFEQINNDTNTENDQAHMEVIQIAESSAGELYLYVYQPTDTELDLTATAVLISTEFSPDGQNINPDIYYLDLVSTEGVFDKYVVKDFRISKEPYRYYNLVTLYRNFNSEIDEVTPGGVVENFELGIGVGQQWCAYYKNDILVYEMNTFDTVEIDIGYTGSFQLGEGLTLGGFVGAFTLGDAWFVTFDVEDYIVEKIFDADLSYKFRSKTRQKVTSSWTTTYGDWSDDVEVTLSSKEPTTYQGDGLFAKKYEWNTISASADFVKELEDQDVELSDEAKSYLSENEWVFAFTQTEKSMTPMLELSSEVSAVTVIRLHFMDITGTVYNLGVVSDRVSPDEVPDGAGDGNDKELLEKILQVLSFLVVLVALIVIWPFVKAVFKIIATGIKFIFSVMWSVVTLPLNIIKFLLGK